MRKLFGLILVIRPHNVAAAVLSTLVGFSMAGRVGLQFWLPAAVAVATAAGNAINDIYDIDIDRINKPRRPLPSNVLTPLMVGTLYVLLLCILIFFLWHLDVPQAVWVAVWVFLLHLYSSKLKRRYLVGNLLVSAVSASGFLLGAFAGGRVSVGVIPACFTFVFVMGRELVKDCEDFEGDRACGAKTVPVVSGKKAARTAAVAIFVALLLGFPVPYITDYYDRSYGLIMVLSVLPILVISTALTIRDRSLGKVSALLKTGMFFGIVAFHFGSRG